MACLMTGYLRNMLSRVTYLLLRLILAMKFLILPHWDSVRRTKQRIRTMLNLTTKESLSVWNNKLFTLSLKRILANVCIGILYFLQSPLHNKLIHNTASG
jgi:ABC-type proline/glycine betaine transport system permease subunit